MMKYALLSDAGFIIRSVQLADVPLIAAIQAQVNPSPWAESTFIAMLKAGYLGWLIDRQQEILGFGFISLAADECQLLDLSIQPQWQNQSLGTQLIQHMSQYAKTHGALHCYLEVRHSNQNAQALYTKLGFIKIAVRRDYYTTSTGHEDAIIMRADISVLLP